MMCHLLAHRRRGQARRPCVIVPICVFVGLLGGRLRPCSRNSTSASRLWLTASLYTEHFMNATWSMQLLVWSIRAPRSQTRSMHTLSNNIGCTLRGRMALQCIVLSLICVALLRSEFLYSMQLAVLTWCPSGRVSRSIGSYTAWIKIRSGMFAFSELRSLCEELPHWTQAWSQSTVLQMPMDQP